MKCRRCQDEIPKRIKIDGEIRNLKNRKFCLVCSPWGFRNTKPNLLNPVKELSKRINENGKRIRESYSKWSNFQKKRAINATKERGIKLKKEYIELLGGKCKNCNYNKCLSVLSFHHKNSNTKEFELSVTSIRKYTKEKRDNEVVKCDLLCLNCHQEEEERISKEKRNISGTKSSIYQHIRLNKIKQYFIDLKGGKCKECGYNKCLRALCFHHRNPKEKKFTLNHFDLGHRSEKNLLKEVNKCDLLCANCHMELHDKLNNGT